jgi:carbonic anhydrase
MRSLPHLFQNNREWATILQHSRPDFFTKLAHQQAPQYLWIGCSDSRVPANEIVGLLPGELFVHRNVANLVIHTDMNCLSVLQYAIEILGVSHVIVCGHYGCGGVKAAIEEKPHGLVDNWLRHIRDIYIRYHHALEAITDEEERIARLCELNVVEQVINVGNTTIVQDAWRAERTLEIHGWIYDVGDGLLRDLKVAVASAEELQTLKYEGKYTGHL